MLPDLWRKPSWTEHFSNNWTLGLGLNTILLVCIMKRQKGEEKLKRRAKLAGNLGRKRYPQPFTPPSLLTGIQTTFVAFLYGEFPFGQTQGVWCFWALSCAPKTLRHSIKRVCSGVSTRIKTLISQ